MSNNTFISFASTGNPSKKPKFEINPGYVTNEPRGIYAYKLIKNNILSLVKDRSISGTYNFTNRDHFHLFSVKDINKNIYANQRANASSYNGNVSRDLKNVVFTTLIFCIKSIENNKKLLEIEFDKDYRKNNEPKSEQFDYYNDIEDLIGDVILYTAREMVVVEKHYNKKFKRKLQDETVNVICKNLIKHFKPKSKHYDKISFIYDAIMVLSKVALRFSNVSVEKYTPGRDFNNSFHDSEFSSMLLKSIGISSLDQKSYFKFVGEKDQAVFYDLKNVDYHGTYNNIFADEYRDVLLKNYDNIESYIKNKIGIKWTSY